MTRQNKNLMLNIPVLVDKDSETAETKHGTLLKFAQDGEQYEGGVVVFPVGIVRMEKGRLRSIFVERITIIDERRENETDIQIEKKQKSG